MRNKRIYLISLGCPKNLVDSEILLCAAAQDGWEITGNIREADLLLVNTCGFIEEARAESLECIRECLGSKAGKKKTTVVVAGCMAQMNARELEEVLPDVDRVIGIGEIEKFRSIVRSGAGKRERASRRRILFPSARHPRLITGHGHSTYVKIGDGCSRKCAFCLIPSIRGKSVSRAPERIVDEIRSLASIGVKEVVLVSQDTTAYGWDLRRSNANLVNLLDRVAAIDRVEWIRLLYLYPHESLGELFDLMARLPRVVPYLDLPVQHSTDRMLRIMRRGYSRRLLDDLITEARKKIPGLAIRTTFLVGHPGESDGDFKDLLQFMRMHDFERIGIMKYSDEKGCRAYSMKGKVGEKKIKLRYRLAVDAASRILERHYGRMKGKHYTVMLDAEGEGSRRGKREKWNARLPTQAPEIDGAVIVSNVGSGERCGKMVKVKITGRSGINLLGKCL